MNPLPQNGLDPAVMHQTGDRQYLPTVHGAPQRGKPLAAPAAGLPLSVSAKSQAYEDNGFSHIGGREPPPTECVLQMLAPLLPSIP